MEERQLTARGKGPKSRAQAWSAWEAAVVEFNRIFSSRVSEKRTRSSFEVAVTRHKFDFVAIGVYPNRGTVKAVPLGRTVPVEVKVIGRLLKDKWWEFEISQDFPELRAAQAALFEATGEPPNAEELGVVKIPEPGFGQTEVNARYREFIDQCVVSPSTVAVEGVAALVVCGVVTTSLPKDTEITISVFVRPDEEVPDFASTPDGVRVVVVRESWIQWYGSRIHTGGMSVRHPSAVLLQMQEEHSKGYTGAIRTWLSRR